MALISFLLDMFFPRCCLACGQVGKQLCATCVAKVSLSIHSYGENIFFMAYMQDAWVRKAIHEVKYGGQPSSLKPWFLAYQAVLRAWAAPYGTVMWVPVPSSKSRLRTRGYNQAQVLAVQLAHLCGGSVMPHVLQKKEATSLVGKNRQQRQQEVGGQLCWRGSLPEAGAYIVVDDVLTTGSTMRHCMQLLRSHTAKPVVGLAVAHEKLE